MPKVKSPSPLPTKTNNDLSPEAVKADTSDLEVEKVESESVSSCQSFKSKVIEVNSFNEELES